MRFGEQSKRSKGSIKHCLIFWFFFLFGPNAFLSTCYVFIFISSNDWTKKLEEKRKSNKKQKTTQQREQLLHKLQKNVLSFTVFNSSNQIAL